MKYKVGDKIRVVESEDFPDMVGKVYTILDVTSSSSDFACRVKDEKAGLNILMFDREIEPAIRIGKQYEFAFMQNE